MTRKPFHEVIHAEVEKLVEPIARAENNRGARESMIEALDLDLTDQEEADLAQLIQNSANGITSTVDALEEPPEDLSELHDYLEDVAAVLDSVRALGQAVQGNDADEVAEQLVDFLVLSYLEREHPDFFYVIIALTLVELPDIAAEETQRRMDPALLTYYAAQHSDLQFSRVPELLGDPGATLKTAYLPEGEAVSEEAATQVETRLFLLLQRLLGSLGFQVNYGLVGPKAVEEADEDDVSRPLDDVSGVEMASSMLSVTRSLGGSQFGFQLAVAIGEDRLAIVVMPFGDLTFSEDVERWKITLELSADGEAIVLSAEGLEPADDGGGTVDEVSATGRVEKLPPKNSTSALAVGPEDGTRLEVGKYGVEGTVDVGDDRTTYDVLASAKDSSFVVRPKGGFLEQVLPKDGISADFDLGLGWHSSGDRGSVYVAGSGSLEATLPVHASIGEVLTVETITVGVSVDDEDEAVPVDLATTVSTKLGPLSALVEGVGLTTDLTFPEGGDGNLGPVNADPAFKPPDGIGLSIDAGGVTGGGYLYFEPEEQRYAGALQLQVGQLTLNAVGLLTTKLPDGSDGFSLLIIISGEFPPVQLGFGFTLNGVGGLLGVNRSTEVKVLRQGVRDGSMNSVLFPRDPVANAQRIVSDLRSIFPPTRAQHVFGPMVKGGWGSPSIITASLGVILELPQPTRLLILGRLRTVLPDDEAALVKLQMNVLGSINFTEQTAGVDASLYDSRVVAFTVTGDMAMRSKWGDQSQFLLSVGGFNPRYDPPDQFPDLDRVAIKLADSDNPRVRVRGYFAVSSNTVQAGAHLDAHGKAGGFGIHAELGFDALVQFDPFKFFLDIIASLSIDTPLGTAGISVEGTISGPGPWHIDGKATFEIGLASFSVAVDMKIGQKKEKKEMPSAEVHGKVTSALSDERNWSAQLPEAADSMVSLREIETNEGTVLAHPLGKLQVRQQVVPLDIHIERFGNSRPADFTKFTISDVQVSDRQADDVDQGDVREQFAPAQYLELSQEEKMNRPSYERYQAGADVGNDLVDYGSGDQAATQTLTYEESYIDEENDARGADTREGHIAVETANALAQVSAVAKSDARNTGRKRFKGEGGDGSVSVSDTRYVVAEVDTMEEVDVIDLPNPGTTYTEAEQSIEAYLQATRASDREYDRDDLQVVASHELAAAGSGGSP